MNRITIFISLFLLPFFSMAQNRVKIIPQPESIAENAGSFFIDNNTYIDYDKADKNLKAAAAFFKTRIKDISGYNLTGNKYLSKSILLKISKTADIGDEGYLLNVTPTSIEIIANTKIGIVYAMQSLFQTLPAVRTNAPLEVPCMTVKDFPRFAWRGMHLDVSRHFFSADVVKEYIDLMAAYKMNVFHWHLVDDQGWRIEIKKYPKLTEVGAWRADRLSTEWRSRTQANPGEAPSYGGYYTQEQIKEIIAYATERNITVVPEIEMPGHNAAVMAVYPDLSCSHQPQLVMTGGNYVNMSQNYCAGNDKVFEFLQDVLTEVIDLFPSTYIHIGGDEVEKTPWKKCPACQARIKAEGLKNEEELQSYFIKRIEKFIVGKNRKVIGWDEILEGGLAPTAAVMSWRGETGGIAAAKMNHDVVMTPGKPCYFDHYQAGPEGEPLAIGGMNTLKRVYDYEPIPKELTESQAKFVMGAQGNVWTEWITTTEHLEYMVLPRMLALAEVVWSPKSTRDWIGFNDRLQNSFRGFDQKGFHYCKGDFKVNIKPETENGKIKATLSTEAVNADIFYTTDGSVPTKSSIKYTAPITIDSSGTLKAVTLVNGIIKSVKPMDQSFIIHKAIGGTVTYKNPISKSYQADGPNSLIDGIRGTTVANKFWHGVAGQDLIATIDLGSEKSISEITIGCLQNYHDWIFMPTSVKFEVSLDGVNFSEVKTIINTVSTDEHEAIIKDFKAAFAEQKAKFIRVTAKVLPTCPKGHPGEGKPTWVFADEIIVN